MPVTATVIKTVEALAKADGMKGLKIRSRTGEILYDSAWIAGVEYEEDAADEDYDPEEDQSDGSSEDEDSNDTDSNTSEDEVLEILDDQANPIQPESEPDPDSDEEDVDDGEDSDDDMPELAQSSDDSDDDDSDDEDSDEEESPQDVGPNVETVPEDEEDDDGSSAGVTASSLKTCAEQGAYKEI